jgi:hypothetical protein
MMPVLNTLSRAFAVLTLLLALYDLSYQWIANAQMKIRTVGEMWADISKEGFDKGEKSLETWLSIEHIHTLLHMPVPVLTGALAALFYIAYRAMLFVTGKDKSHRI